MILTISKSFRYEREIKKSRFVANAFHAASTARAMEFVERIKDPQASHNCWAYRIGGEYKFSDDGEPAGTAGRPILGAIEKQGLDRVVVVVTRYFGGIKLGAGGLARAYLGTAAECLRSADKQKILDYLTVKFEADFDATGSVHAAVEKQGARMVGERYTESGINAEIEVEENSAESLRTALLEATRGKGVFTIRSRSRNQAEGEKK
ncbi:MAG TPA: YigZ family protein [Desulfobacteraceae bacterium]|nr:YigZ family protein [Desulfobacteraceae bacterium]